MTHLDFPQFPLVTNVEEAFKGLSAWCRRRRRLINFPVLSQTCSTAETARRLFPALQFDLLHCTSSLLPSLKCSNQGTCWYQEEKQKDSTKRWLRTSWVKNTLAVRGLHLLYNKVACLKLSLCQTVCLCCRTEQPDGVSQSASTGENGCVEMEYIHVQLPEPNICFNWTRCDCRETFLFW